ncbi:carboxypeptidase B-like [Ruditapes philippinarum]|uniref:carboxypeptidase B-like n=1 Tax=Ruditapes philippinarum TaxID=129788 RepID=UPI00295C0A44|nr:carboxypeptidase B-like [Ruditapes philippinarum]
MLLLVTLAIFVPLGTLGHGPWTGHKVIKVTPNTEQEVKHLQNLLFEERHLDVWRAPSSVNNSVDIRLSPFEYDDVTNYLLEKDMFVKIMIEDVQQIIDEQKAYRNIKVPKANQFEYSKYHQLDDIYDWMQNITNVYKDKASMFNITKSYEGRELVGIKISTQPQNADRPAFWIEGGIHPEEWISPATVVFMAGQMLDLYKLDMELTEMVDSFDWYILPVTNPDGYAYTFVDDSTRLWRKTRSKHGACRGVDANRNWDWDWCKSGASKDPCSNIYCGPNAFSEVEIKGVADYMSKIENLKGFINFHSYTQQWLSPWASTNTLPVDFKIQDEGSTVAVKALEQVYGTKFAHGEIANRASVASGLGVDWVYGKLGAKFAYDVQLRDDGKYGFLLPDDQIIPSGKETLEALKALAKYVRNN